MQTIYLDISCKGVIPCIQAKQSEVGRKFLAVITDNGIPYNIPDNSLLSVWYEGDTDAGNYSSIEEKSAFSIDGNKVTVELVAQMLLKPGNGELCLSITHGDGGETNTWNIPYCVEYKPGAGSAVPTEYYTALTDAAARVADKVGLATAQAELAKEYAEEAKKTVDESFKSNGSVPMSGNIDMNENLITSLGAPQSPNDAATKQYADGKIERPVAITDMNEMTSLFGYVSPSTANIPFSSYGFALNYQVNAQNSFQYIFYLAAPGRITSRVKSGGSWGKWSLLDFSTIT